MLLDYLSKQLSPLKQLRDQVEIVINFIVLVQLQNAGMV